MMHTGITNYQKILKEKNLRATPSRIGVLRVLADNSHPIDIEGIKKGLGADCPNNVTVYRIMEDLSAAGIVRQIDLRQGRTFFEIMPEEDDHHHIVCVSCKKIEDVHGCILTDEIDRAVASSKHFSTPVDHVFEIFALCSDCEK